MNENKLPPLFTLSTSDLAKNIQLAAQFLDKNKLAGLYISSSDVFLNEYTPREECHRYYFSGFTGSVAELLLLSSGKSILFVDGRYHEQADLECQNLPVEVYKCSYGEMPFVALKKKLQQLGIKTLGIEGQRTSLKYALELSSLAQVSLIDEQQFNQLIETKNAPCLGEAKLLSKHLVGEEIEQKLSRVLEKNKAIFLTALDSIAWLTNSRGYQLPFQSTFRAKALITAKRIYLFKEKDTLIESGIINHPLIEIREVSFVKMSQELHKLHAEGKIERLEVSVEFARITAHDYQVLCDFYGKDKVKDLDKGILPFHALKNETEIKQMEISFHRADQAILKTIKWIKESIAQGIELSELDFYHGANRFYAEGGSLMQSFKTIAAIGSNSSIIHFGSPSALVKIKKGDLALLDSGAFYEAGIATDCTRTFLAGGEANPLQKKIYTLVLKSLLNVQNAVFPEGTIGSFVDGVARMPMLMHGYNYAHGTGHGVGINVHEGMYSIVPFSSVPLYANLVGSLEPGIYLPGIGGVRLENICVVEKHPSFSGMLRFRSLSYVPFDPALIDMTLMNNQEVEWLNKYHKECAEKGMELKS